jgi:hypothetical protein
MLLDEPVRSPKLASSGAPASESAIRHALKKRWLRYYRGRTDILVVEELGLAHARSRIDLAVFNGHLHGYEIKSAGDTLSRLPSQLGIYRDALQKLTLVVAARHLEAAYVLIPDWCGLVEVRESPRGKVFLETRRRSKINPDLDPFVLAHLLWRPEAQQLLRTRGAPPSELGAPRKHLYRMLAEQVPIPELASSIKLAMASRARWRDHLRLS